MSSNGNGNGASIGNGNGNGEPSAFDAPPAAPTSESGHQHQASPSPASLPHGGRPIPKQTAAGALLTGGFNTHKVYIGNLPETATLADLEDCFGQLGQCSCSIKRGFGFVDYTDPASAAEAVAKYHEGHFLGAQIKVELSHARQGIPKALDSDGKTPIRNPPGSDRPSDARKPMHINGPPGQDKRRNRGPAGGPPDFPRDPVRRDGDRYMPGAPPLAPPRGDAPPYDRYRDDFRDSRGPPPQPYQDPRYPPQDFGRGGYGAPPPRDSRGAPPPLGYGSAPPPRDARDRPPYDPYYDSAPPRGGDYPPYSATRPPPAAPLPSYGLPPADLQRPYVPPVRDPYALDRYADTRAAPLVPPFDQPRGGPGGEAPRPPYAPHDPYDARGPPPLDGPGADRYDPRGPAPIVGRDDRGAPRYNPYGRPPSPRMDDRRGGAEPGYGRSPHRGGPPSERRRSLSPRRGGDFGAPGAAPIYPPFDAGRPAGGYGAPRAADEYNPRR